MIIRSLYLHHFRSVKEELINFGPNLNFIYGANALGKTTILEAIHFLIMGRSFRTVQTRELIERGADFFYLEAQFVKHGVEQKLKITCRGGERKVVYNDTVCPSNASLLGLMQGVVVTPDDVSLVKGSPQNRRHLLDVQIAQADPLYVHHLTRYLRGMRQRNHLLRAKNLVTIEAWEYEMAASAAYVVRQRQKAVKELQTLAAKVYAHFSNEKDPLNLQYKSGTPEGEADLSRYFVEQYAKCRPKEMLLGYTHAGPHRDDLHLSLGDKEVRLYASEGQKRGVVVALKFAEWQRLSALVEEKPLMLLDDVGMGLDEKRKERLFAYVSRLNQVFITSTQDYPFAGECHRIFRA